MRLDDAGIDDNDAAAVVVVGFDAGNFGTVNIPGWMLNAMSVPRL
jgi:hypothetical protein